MIIVKKINHNNGHVIETTYSNKEENEARRDADFYNSHKSEGYSAEIELIKE